MGAQGGFFDGFVNFLSGLGIVGRDKSTGAVFSYTPLTQMELEAAYRSDWVSRKIVDIPADDATREWRAWQTLPKNIEKLEEAEKALDLQRKLRDALRLRRLYGGSAIVLGAADAVSEAELQVDAVRQGDLKFIRVVSRYSIHEGPLITDINSPFVGQPEYFSTVGVGEAQQIKIHPSRVICFKNMNLDNTSIANQNAFWGDSVLQPLMDAIKAATTVNMTVATLVHESKFDIIKVPGLTQMIASDAYQKQLTARFSTANALKSVINTILLDKEEEWERITTQFAAFPELIRMYLLIVSGAADIPATRMLSQSPAGLSATGESDIRNYYDMTSNQQKTELTPALSRFDEILIRHALGSRDPSIYYDWNPLWQLSSSEKATVAKSKADTFKVDIDAGIVDEEALRIGRQNQLIEDGTYPGLEEALEDLALLEVTSMTTPEERLAEEQAQLEQQAKLAAPAPVKRIAAPVGDAEPKSLYVRRDLKNIWTVRKWAQSQGFKSILKDLHTTIIYSKTPVDWMKMGEAFNSELTVTAGGPRIIERLGPNGAVVLSFLSYDLKYRNDRMREQGASTDFPEFQAHMTITYDGPEDLSSVEPYIGVLKFGPEIFEEIDEEKRAPGWKPNFEEVSLKDGSPFDGLDDDDADDDEFDDSNPYHEPAGSEHGGEFASKGGGTGSKPLGTEIIGGQVMKFNPLTGEYEKVAGSPDTPPKPVIPKLKNTTPKEDIAVVAKQLGVKAKKEELKKAYANHTKEMEKALAQYQAYQAEGQTIAAQSVKAAAQVKIDKFNSATNSISWNAPTLKGYNQAANELFGHMVAGKSQYTTFKSKHVEKSLKKAAKQLYVPTGVTATEWQKSAASFVQGEKPGLNAEGVPIGMKKVPGPGGQYLLTPATKQLVTGSIAPLDSEEIQFLKSYTAGSGDVNGALRSTHGKDYHPHTQQKIKKLDSVMAKSVVMKEVTVYRGFYGFENLKEGEIYEDKGFGSFSKVMQKAKGFGSTVIAITLKEGMPAIDVEALSHHPNEKEVILPRGWKVKITKVEGSSDIFSTGKTLHAELL